MMGDGTADCMSITINDVKYAGWEACSFDELGKTECGKRGDF
jgi:hypothetical protein